MTRNTKATPPSEERQPVPFLRTKLHRPPVTEKLVYRKRLHDALDLGLRRPLTMLSAPAGYGKSMLVSHWLESRPEPQAWLSLDESDSDLQRFAGYLIAAVQTAYPDACANTLAMLQAPGLLPMEVIAGSLINELDAIDASLILVLDDYHRIDDPQVHELLDRLLQYPPPHLHLVITARRDPPLQLNSMLAGGRMTELRLKDLEFTVPETAILLKQELDLSVSDSALDHLQEELEGWVTGLHLVSLTLRDQDDPERYLAGLHGGLRQIQDYLLEEVLARQPTAVQDWLMKTSILDRFCAPLCEAICASDHEAARTDLDGKTFVQSLEARNLFCIPLDERGDWHRYHHLFQWLLQRRLERNSNAQEIATLHLRASEWFESQDLIDEAIRHALLAGNPVRAAEIFERHRRIEQDADRWRVVERWLAGLPEEIKQERPGLLLAQAWILHDRYELPQIGPIVEQLESLLDSIELDQVSVGEFKFFQAVLLFWQGQGETSLKRLLEATARIPRTHPRMRGLAEIYMALGRQMIGQGDVAERELVEKIRRADSQSSALLSRLYLAQALMLSVSGPLIRVGDAARLAECESETIGLEYIHGWGLYLQAFSRFHFHDLDAASRLFARVVEKRYVSHTRMALDALIGLALTYQAAQRPVDVAETSRLLLEFALESKDPQHLKVANSGLARLSLAQGDLKSAIRWARAFDEEPNAPGMFIWLENPALTRARVQIAAGTDKHLRQTLELLESLRQQFKDLHNTNQTIEVLVLQSLLLSRWGDADAALAVLEQALALAGPRGCIRPFVEPGRPMADLLKRAMKQGAHADYAREILLAFGARASEPLADTGQLVEPFTNREEEVLELLGQRLRYKEIGEKLFISTETVKSHLQHVYQKLGVSNRREAIAKARSLGLLIRR